jgi:uncharacterized protein (TIGR02246 family)
VMAEERIRETIDAWANAVRAKDVDQAMIHYAPDVVSFDLAPPLEYRGADSIRRSLEAWFRSFQGPIGYEMTALDIMASGDLAVCRSLNRISGKRTNGEDTDVWVRVTAVLRRAGEAWLIQHEHVSVPFYMDGSDRAALDLHP